MRRMTTTLLILLALPMMAGAVEYSIDALHSGAESKVRHMGISKVPGHFSDFEGEFAFDMDAPEKGWSRAVIRVASVETGNDKRDAHLRAPDFFDAEKHPEMRFESGAPVMGKEGWTLPGRLTLRGVTRDIVLDLELLGETVGPGGKKRVGFTATGKLDRRDYGLGFHKVLETGGLVVGDQVEITLEIQGIEN